MSEVFPEGGVIGGVLGMAFEAYEAAG